MERIPRRRILACDHAVLKRINSEHSERDCTRECSYTAPAKTCRNCARRMGEGARPPQAQPCATSSAREFCRRLKPEVQSPHLRGFDQLHFAVSRAVQDHDFAFGVAEYENVAVAEVGFFDGFFERHGAHGDGFVGADQMHLGGFGHRWIFMHDHRYSRFFRETDRGLQVVLRGQRRRRMAVPLFCFFNFARRAFLRLPARFVFDGLLFQMVERFIDGDDHFPGLGQANQRAVAGADVDFSFVAVLFDGEDHLGFKSVAENFADLGEAGFDFFADGGSNFVVSSRVFHVHERPLVKFLIEMNWALYLKSEVRSKNAEVKSLASAFSTLAIFDGFCFYFCILTSYVCTLSLFGAPPHSQPSMYCSASY